ncbi:FAD-dependent oxidoreductase [Saccharopolyspora spinosporotrichia]
MTGTGGGKVVVVGAGLAGITAALDCADRGHEVTLLEGRPGSAVPRARSSARTWSSTPVSTSSCVATPRMRRCSAAWASPTGSRSSRVSGSPCWRRVGGDRCCDGGDFPPRLTWPGPLRTPPDDAARADSGGAHRDGAARARRRGPGARPGQSRRLAARPR